MAVVKTYFNHIDRLWVEDPASGRQLQITAGIVQPTTSRDTLTRIETQITNADSKAKKLDSAETIDV